MKMFAIVEMVHKINLTIRVSRTIDIKRINSLTIVYFRLFYSDSIVVPLVQQLRL